MCKQYIRIERSLLLHGHEFGLSLDAMLLYDMMRDRTTLSAKNGLYDASGRIFIYCSRESAADMVGCSVRKAVTLFQELIGAGLISEKFSGGCRRIFVKQWSEPSIMYSVENLRNGGFLDITTDRVHVMPEGYVTIDMSMFDTDISNRAKLLYALLSDESSEQELYGRDTCSLPRDEAMALLNCSRDTLRKTYAELEDAGLIIRSGRQGFGQQRAVSVASDSGLIFASQWAENCTSVGDNLHVQWAENCTQTNLSNPSVKNHPSEASLCAPAYAGRQEAPEKENRENLLDWNGVSADMEVLCHNDTLTAQEVAEAVKERIERDTASNRKSYVIGSQRDVSKETLMDIYSSIDRYTMDTLISKLVDNWDRIKDKERYIRAALYNADKHSGEAYYTQRRLEG